MKKTKIAIWLDFRTANLITLKGKDQTIKSIASDMDTSKPKGGARAKLRYGATDTISEKNYLEKRKNQEKAYYEKIIAAVQTANEVMVCGPAKAKEGLMKVIKASTTFHPTFKGFATTDSQMTINQKMAFVRDFFEKN